MNVRMCSIVSKHAAFVCTCVVFGSAGPLPGCSKDNRPLSSASFQLRSSNTAAPGPPVRKELLTSVGFYSGSGGSEGARG